MGAEAGAGGDAVLVDDAQAAEAHVVGIVIVGETEAMPGIEPAVVGVASFDGGTLGNGCHGRRGLNFRITLRHTVRIAHASCARRSCSKKLRFPGDMEQHPLRHLSPPRGSYPAARAMRSNLIRSTRSSHSPCFCTCGARSRVLSSCTARQGARRVAGRCRT